MRGLRVVRAVTIRRFLKRMKGDHELKHAAPCCLETFPMDSRPPPNHRQIGGLVNQHYEMLDQEAGFAGPIGFSASNPRFVANFPDDQAQVWSADITAGRTGGESHVFESILFIEDEVTVSIYGVECEDGRPPFLRTDLAARQQQFIAFLREETATDNRTLGPIRKIFTGHQYSSELKATGAYVASRDSKLDIGVGFRDEEGGYTLLAVPSADY